MVPKETRRISNLKLTSRLWGNQWLELRAAVPLFSCEFQHLSQTVSLTEHEISTAVWIQVELSRWQRLKLPNVYKRPCGVTYFVHRRTSPPSSHLLARRCWLLAFAQSSGMVWITARPKHSFWGHFRLSRTNKVNRHGKSENKWLKLNNIYASKTFFAMLRGHFRFTRQKEMHLSGSSILNFKVKVMF